VAVDTGIRLCIGLTVLRASAFDTFKPGVLLLCTGGFGGATSRGFFRDDTQAAQGTPTSCVCSLLLSATVIGLKRSVCHDAPSLTFLRFIFRFVPCTDQQLMFVCSVAGGGAPQYAPLPPFSTHTTPTAHTATGNYSTAPNSAYISSAGVSSGQGSDFASEYARHAPTSAEEAFFSAHNRTFPTSRYCVVAVCAIL
jgi:hypothetical protein